MNSQSATRRYVPTPEQIALAQERKAKKLAAAVPETNSQVGRISERPWLPIETSCSFNQDDQRIKVFTWNVCAIVRSTTAQSDVLLTFSYWLSALSEVDRLERLLPVLKNAGYSHHYASGPGKKHGCLVAFKEDIYKINSSKTVFYDNEEIRDTGDDVARRGKTFHTRNIGSLVSLESKIAGKAEGVIIATTHLFWHPKQAGILVRETNKFRAELSVEHWPCIIGGDFNFGPNDVAYSLLVGDLITSEQEDILRPSYVVHSSVDPTVAKDPRPDDGNANEEGGDPDKVITSARTAVQSDGLLSVSELVDFFARIPKLRSCYDVGLSRAKGAGDLRTFGDRVVMHSTRLGRHEPEYTSYTHFWKATLDYVFVLDPSDRESNVVAVLSPHKTEDLQLGLPQLGVSGSDHVSLAVELQWSKRPSKAL
ncbi:hypothetical protein H0H93_005260 [Arthromyces matolae]|nr:hypothetical protein H0H93_005260 [Arthromyces matolae]